MDECDRDGALPDRGRDPANGPLTNVAAAIEADDATDLRFATAQALYARGVAFAAKGDREQAEEARGLLEERDDGTVAGLAEGDPAFSFADSDVDFNL